MRINIFGCINHLLLKTEFSIFAAAVMLFSQCVQAQTAQAQTTLSQTPPTQTSATHTPSAPAPPVPATVEQRIEALESQLSFNKIRFTGIYRTLYDNINSSESGQKQKYNPLRMYFALNANAALSERLLFSSRMGISKFFNPLTYSGASSGSPELSGSREEAQGQNIRLERAYFDYKITDHLWVSAGRLPTIDGPSYQFYDGIKRQGAYPMLGYSAILDGMALAYEVPDLGTHKLIIKGVYTPLYSASFAQNNTLNQATASQGPGSPSRPEYSEITTAMAEYSAPPISLWDELNIITLFTDIKNAKLNDQYARGTDLRSVLSNSSFGGTGLQPGAGLNAPVPANSYFFQGSNLEYSYNVYAVYLEIKNALKSGLDFGMTLLGTQVHSKGFYENNASIATASNNQINLRKGILTDKDAQTTNGSAVLVTAAYHVPSPVLHNPVFGAEYLYSNKNYLYFEYATDSVTQFYSTRGQGYHGWYTQPLHNGDLKLRLGYMNQNHLYSKGIIGAPTKTNLIEQTLYSYLRLDF